MALNCSSSHCVLHHACVAQKKEEKSISLKTHFWKGVTDFIRYGLLSTYQELYGEKGGIYEVLLQTGLWWFPWGKWYCQQTAT